jgi:hypothetical protein
VKSNCSPETVKDWLQRRGRSVFREGQEERRTSGGAAEQIASLKKRGKAVKRGFSAMFLLITLTIIEECRINPRNR